MTLKTRRLGLLFTVSMAASGCGGTTAPSPKKDDPAAADPRCGDGQVDVGEECDTAAILSDQTADACRTDCTGPRCGDGVVDTNEGCDTGDALFGESGMCSSRCTTFSWKERAPLPVPTFAAAACEHQGKVYLTGGEGEGANSDRLDEFDPESDTWTHKASMAVARSGHTCEVVNGKLMVFGGHEEDSVEEYDPGLNQWAPLSPMPSPRARHTTVVVNDTVYAFGGHNSDAPVPYVDQYDAATNEWARVGSMPRPRWGVTGVALENGVYLVGGVDHLPRPGEVNSDAKLTERFDHASGEWEMKTPSEHPALLACGVSLEGRLIVVGGNFNRLLMRIFDPATNTWTYGPSMPDEREYITCAAVGSSIFVFGGRGEAGQEPLSGVLEFGPD